MGRATDGAFVMAWPSREATVGRSGPSSRADRRTFRAAALDDWLAHFGIVCAIRHQAASDTLATAELLLRLWPALRGALPKPGLRAAQALAAAQRWMPS